MTFRVGEMDVFLFDSKRLPDLPAVSRFTVSEVVAKTAATSALCRSQTALVSAANAVGFMDGGSDAGYMDAIPEIETQVKQGIRRGKAYVSRNGRPYIPVGDAMGFPLPDGRVFVTAPTMYLPHDVSMTRNPFHAFQAALRVCKAMGVQTVFCPMMCTGYGKIGYAESFEMMRDAAARVDRTRVIVSGGYVYTNTPQVHAILAEQPKIYDMVEFGGEMA